MIRRIVLQNFMAHRHTEIEPAEGLTVLTGPNNCGKSAVVVALQTLCCNERSSKTFVRHGQKEARVLIETSEGHKLEWIRGKEVSYRVNGREVHRLKGGLPDDLHQLLRLPTVVDAQGMEFDIHFAEQKSPIFLLNEPPSRAATFFAASSDAGLLLKMQSRHKDKVKDARTQERIFAQQADKARQELSTYEGLDELEQRVVEVTRAYESLTTQLQRAERLYEEAVRLERQMASAMELADRTEALRPLEPPPSQHDVVSLEAHCRRQQDRERTVQRELARSQAMDALQPPPPLEDEVHLRTVVDVVARRSQYVERMRRKLALTADLPQPPELSDLQPLRQVVQSMERQAQQVAGAKSRHADAEAALVAGRRLIDEYVGAHPTCPVCGGRLTAEQVIAGGADA